MKCLRFVLLSMTVALGACQESGPADHDAAVSDTSSPHDTGVAADTTVSDTGSPDDTGVATDTAPSGDTGASARGKVTVWMGMGPREGAAGCYFVGDLQNDGTGCAIVRVRWDVDQGTFIEEETAVANPGGGVGVWQPNVSGDGKTLAFARHSGGGVEVRTASIVPGDLGEGSPIAPLQAGVWTWPNLAADGRLTVSSGDKAPRCQMPTGDCKDVSHWSQSYQLTGAFSKAPVSISGTGFSFQDTYAHPTRPEFVAGHGKFDTVHPDTYPVCDDPAKPDSPCPDITMSPMPIVVNTETKQVWILQLESMEVLDDSVSTPWQLEGCAHLAWAPDGKHLICTEQGSHKVLTPEKSSRLYHFAFDPDAPPPMQGVVPTAAEPLFAHAIPSELFEIPAGKQCDVFHHKYAEFCGEDLVVATIGCADCEDNAPCALFAEEPPVLLSDRVYLIDIKDPAAPKYFDLTAAVEVSRGAATNSLTSFTATCRPD